MERQSFTKGIAETHGRSPDPRLAYDGFHLSAYIHHLGVQAEQTSYRRSIRNRYFLHARELEACNNEAPSYARKRCERTTSCFVPCAVLEAIYNEQDRSTGQPLSGRRQGTDGSWREGGHGFMFLLRFLPMIVSGETVVFVVLQISGPTASSHARCPENEG